MCTCVLSHVQLCATPWTLACQMPLPMEFSRQEYWSGLPFPTSGDLPDRDQTYISCVSCIGRQILYPCTNWEAQSVYSITVFNNPHY